MIINHYSQEANYPHEILEPIRWNHRPSTKPYDTELTYDYIIILYSGGTRIYITNEGHIHDTSDVVRLINNESSKQDDSLLLKNVKHIWQVIPSYCDAIMNIDAAVARSFLERIDEAPSIAHEFLKASDYWEVIQLKYEKELKKRKRKARINIKRAD